MLFFCIQPTLAEMKKALDNFPIILHPISHLFCWMFKDEVKCFKDALMHALSVQFYS